MTQQEATGSGAEEGESRRFDVELFIVHPEWEPTDISIALELEAHFYHRVGDQMKTPRGTLLKGT